MDQGRLTDLIIQEIERAVSGPVDDLVASFQVGLFLQSWITVMAVVQQSVVNFFLDLASNFRQIPIRVAAQVLAQSASKEDSTRVITLLRAKQTAINLALGAVYDLSGGRPPPVAGYAARAGSVKGLRGRFIKKEEDQILGKVLSRLFGMARAPAQTAIRVALFLWQMIISLMAIGGVLVVYQLVKSNDWEEMALSQSRPRKRVRETVNKRV